jgi:hypothetical protein
MPANASDGQLSHRFLQVFKPTTATLNNNLADDEALKIFSCHITTAICCNPVSVSSQSSQHGLEQLWKEARDKDQVYQSAWKAVKDGKRKLPTALDLRLSISECKIDNLGNLLYWNQRWVPESEPLRTSIINAIHTSRALGHPGKKSHPPSYST